jgi:uncharacterized membrane protein
MTERRLRIAIAALAVAGLGVAGYLTWVHYGDLEPICVAGSGGCERVQTSDYAELAGVPVALLGVIGYASILASLALPGDGGRFAGALLALAGFGFSAWLTYVEVFEIDAICQWCVASAVIMTALAVLTSLRVAAPRPAGSGHRRS